VETIINYFLAMPLWAKAGVLIGASVLCGFSFGAGRAAAAATLAWLTR
jgi:Na+-driven multidrug efflux pump